MSAITIGGNLVHYEVLGRGRPVLLLHGWIGSWRYWIPLMQQLQLKYRVYALDLIGFGDSEKDTKAYSIESQVQIIPEFLDAVGCPKIAIIGHGIGGLIASQFANEVPERVIRLILTSVPTYVPEEISHFQLLTSHEEDTPKYGERSEGKIQVSAQPYNPLLELVGTMSPNDLLKRCFRPNEEAYSRLQVDIPKMDPQVIGKSIANFNAVQYPFTLRSLEMPTLFAHGANDTLILPPSEKVIEYIGANQANSEKTVAIFSDTRHFPMLETATFRQLAMSFLETANVRKMVRSLTQVVLGGESRPTNTMQSIPGLDSAVELVPSPPDTPSTPFLKPNRLHDVFMSYSHKDHEIMRRIQNDMKRSRLTVWTDEQLEVGTPDWQTAIEHALQATGCVVAILSPDAKLSGWVREELNYASLLAVGIYLVLFRGQELDSIPFGYTRYQYVDIRARYDEPIMNLIATIRKHL